MSKKSRKTRYPTMISNLEIQFNSNADAAQQGVSLLHGKTKGLGSSMKDAIKAVKSAYDPTPEELAQGLYDIYSEKMIE